jgi:hypothetical protein
MMLLRVPLLQCIPHTTSSSSFCVHPNPVSLLICFNVMSHLAAPAFCCCGILRLLLLLLMLLLPLNSCGIELPCSILVPTLQLAANTKRILTALTVLLRSNTDVND